MSQRTSRLLWVLMFLQVGLLSYLTGWPGPAIHFKNLQAGQSKKDPRPAHKSIFVKNYAGCDTAEFLDFYGGDGKLDIVLCTYKDEGVVAITPRSTDGTKWSDWENKFEELKKANE